MFWLQLTLGILEPGRKHLFSLFGRKVFHGDLRRRVREPGWNLRGGEDKRHVRRQVLP